ncbi:TlpA disulfide reductase family protein [Mucilaginibacter arboris]|uniref:Redoxin domain-containing protein n=1 Tax=Mucilaginibacter arboris TaxID=2682090 RepID=A0A7K1T011_9SPHI|nr:TlpA disulfide reductase family protein [Mucilaginibacter arboris]MVN22905.1 redoxin domain-containing protein [Mucilaginibacter arboris]
MTQIRLFLLLLMVVFVFQAKAQQKAVRLLTIDQLEKRVSHQDTVFIVNFWATWCGPCVKELPVFDQLQKTYKNQPLKVLLISMDFKSKLNTAVVPFVQNHHFTSEVFLADKSSEQEFIDRIDKNWSGALPGTLVINTKKNLHKFYEQEFTYPELNKLYQNSK